MRLLHYLGGVKSEQQAGNNKSSRRRNKSSERGDNVREGGKARYNLMGTEGLSAGLSGLQLIPSSWQNQLPGLPQSIFGQQTKLMRHIQCQESSLGLNSPLVLFWLR